MKKVTALLLVLVLMLCFAGCTPQQKIIGTWKNQTSALGVVVETSYTFNEDGTGTMSTFLLTGIAFTYTISGDVLTITSNVLGVEGTTEFQVEFEGDRLTMTANGESVTLTKEK